MFAYSKYIKLFLNYLVFSLCIHPLLHDLNSTSFIRRASNSNSTMENLNDKAVSASEIYTTGSTFFSSTSSNLSRTTIEIRDHSNNMWHFSALFGPPPPCVTFYVISPSPSPPPLCDVTKAFINLHLYNYQ